MANRVFGVLLLLGVVVIAWTMASRSSPEVFGLFCVAGLLGLSIGHIQLKNWAAFISAFLSWFAFLMAAIYLYGGYEHNLLAPFTTRLFRFTAVAGVAVLLTINYRTLRGVRAIGAHRVGTA
ncbi:hypothetical protein [Hydrocarboniphaga sp.]|uniref:hypothetical protein n=1 Tax=Hydrocarboniphaga sp. TaxID=2033016 RepID=UPI00262705B1|nr:hypothetical protein [Hydrocarboniphaga sp.]